MLILGFAILLSFMGLFIKPRVHKIRKINETTKIIFDEFQRPDLHHIITCTHYQFDFNNILIKERINIIFEFNIFKINRTKCIDQMKNEINNIVYRNDWLNINIKNEKQYLLNKCNEYDCCEKNNSDLKLTMNYFL